MKRKDALSAGGHLPSQPVESANDSLLSQVAASFIVAENGRTTPPSMPKNHIERVATKTGELMEVIHRSRLGLTSQLDRTGYARLITDMLQDAGCAACEYIVNRESVHFTTRSCEFSHCSMESGACHLVIGVVGSVAARNFGYAKVDLQRFCTGEESICECRVDLDPNAAAHRPGTEFSDAPGALENIADSFGCNSIAQPQAATGNDHRPDIVARSPQMQHILDLVEKVAPTPATILITGETGVGKECFTRILHALSGRPHDRFVGVNCGAIPENLIESALFGHERGAFTGAHARYNGYFERASGGTLFLDEVDSLSPAVQVRLLRVLQEGEYERVGGRQTLRSGARIVAATNALLSDIVDAGRFRRDLYYRLNVVNIHVPPLRERPDDIPALSRHILGKLNQRYGGQVTGLAPLAERSLMAYHWPGNVRELENVLERSYLFASGSRLDNVLIDLPATTNVGSDTLPSLAPVKEPPGWKGRKKTTMQDLERQAIVSALKRHRGNVARAAESMGFSRRAVYLKVHSYGLELQAFRA
ncbi:MAG: sigma-54 dependent transcriptional regulator [Candidatus Thiodiazotropha sp. (ex Monitilora ramsayi)]|nr:sigma-54 dependent transcriptional regulator [Candidatus Thiodiazotropha sp. (ex Monitilora ramsayi)]